MSWHWHWYLCAVSGLMRMKPADCWKLFGPRPLTSFSWSRLKKGPFFSRHSTMLLARPAFRPATCLQKKKANTSFDFLCLIIFNGPFEYYRMLNRHWLSILCISHLTATLKSWMFWKLVTATDVNTPLTLHILSENCTLKVDPKGMEILFHINQILTCSHVKN